MLSQTNKIFRYIHMVVPRRVDPSQTQIDGQYEDEYSCCPPPVCMVIVSLLEIILHITDEVLEPGSTSNANGRLARLFMYDPRRRREAWRFLTYMFVHVGYAT